MRKRFQNGSVKKSVNGRYWIGSWREDDGEGGRTQRSRVLGKVSTMTKTTAREEMAEIVKPVNERTACLRQPDVTVEDFVKAVYLNVYTQSSVESRVQALDTLESAFVN